MSLADRLTEFEDTLNTTLAQSVQAVVHATRNRLLGAQQIADLSSALMEMYPAHFNMSDGDIDDPEYGADFDLSKVINDQIRMIEAIKRKVTNSNGSIKDDVSVKEARELITSSSSVIQQLMKHQKDLININRQQALEASVIKAVKTLPQDAQTEFFNTLEDLLEGADG